MGEFSGKARYSTLSKVHGNRREPLWIFFQNVVQAVKFPAALPHLRGFFFEEKKLQAGRY